LLFLLSGSPCVLVERLNSASATPRPEVLDYGRKS